jgi:hypothetical protein
MEFRDDKIGLTFHLMALCSIYLNSSFIRIIQLWSLKENFHVPTL